MTRPEKAIEFFNSGHNCAQSVLLAFEKDLISDKELIIKIASGFGGGMARMQETCGAITGSIMAIGLAAYDPAEDYPTSKERVYSIISEFIQHFKDKYGSTLCSELLNCNLSTEEGNRLYEEMGLREKICVKCVRDSVEILEKLIIKK